MKVLTCASTRRRLNAFHDEELPVSDQIAVMSHLEWCTACAATHREMQMVRSALRSAPRRLALPADDLASFTASVVNRAKAEEGQSLGTRVREMFEDMHFVYAGLGAAAALLVCVVVMFGMMRFVTNEQPQSLAALVKLLGSPGSNQNPVSVGARVSMPRALDQSSFAAADGMGDLDAVFTFAAVVTREGRLANVELLRANGVPWVEEGSDEAKLVEDLIGAASRARFEPASLAGSPVAVNMVLIIAHTTVRGSKEALELPVVPPAKKRAAQKLEARPALIRTA